MVNFAVNDISFLSKMLNFFFFFFCKYRQKSRCYIHSLCYKWRFCLCNMVHFAENFKLYGFRMVNFAPNGNFASAKWLNFALKGVFSLWNNVTYATICCFPCQISNFATNGNIPSAEWLTFPLNAIFLLSRMLCGIWLFTVYAHKYKHVYKFVYLWVCVMPLSGRLCSSEDAVVWQVLYLQGETGLLLH